MPERPVLTARWTDLLLLNFAVPVDTITRLAPPGTEPDLHDGAAYISIVGFRFTNVRLFGLPIPGHTRFDEINLRYYVKRTVGNETRRGVVFVREIVPRRAVAVVANRFYHENYIVRPIRSSIHVAESALAPGDSLEYAWRTRLRLSGLKPRQPRTGTASPPASPLRSNSQPQTRSTNSSSNATGATSTAATTTLANTASRTNRGASLPPTTSSGTATSPLPTPQRSPNSSPRLPQAHSSPTAHPSRSSAAGGCD